MKSYNQFALEAYAAHQELHEVLGAIKRIGARAIPGLQTAYGLGLGTHRLLKGDLPGAALGYASAVPGPVGWAAVAADVGRELLPKGGSPKTPPTKSPDKVKPAPSSVSPTPEKQKPISQTVLAKKGGVEGTLDKKSGKFTAGEFTASQRTGYEKVRGAKQLATDAEKLKTRTDADVARSGYAGQKIKPLELEKPVSLIPMKPQVSSSIEKPVAPKSSTTTGAPSRLPGGNYSPAATQRMSLRTRRMLGAPNT